MTTTTEPRTTTTETTTPARKSPLTAVAAAVAGVVAAVLMAWLADLTHVPAFVPRVIVGLVGLWLLAQVADRLLRKRAGQ